MPQKKIKVPFYTIEEASVQSCFHDTKLPNGWLYANDKNETKITAENLPEHYISMTVYKRQRYISVKRIKDIVCYPNYHINHMHKDDIFYISYDKSIRNEKCRFYSTEILEFHDCDALLWGANIIDFIETVRKYKSYDIELIVAEVIRKEKYFMENYHEYCLEHMYLLNEKSEDWYDNKRTFCWSVEVNKRTTRNWQQDCTTRQDGIYYVYIGR